MPSTYLLHFSRKLAHAQHYAGYTPADVQERLRKHRAGTGSCLCRAVAGLGIRIRLAQTWTHDTNYEARVHERRLKDTHNLARYCPICQAKRARMEARMQEA